MDKEICALIW